MSEKFNLKWNDFQSVVSQSFSVLRREEDFFDVTLVSDDEIQISAHKLILSACSDFFKSILKRNSHSHPLLYLSGVDSKNLGFVLDYIYHGEVKIFEPELDSFLEIAEKLKIEGLLSNDDSQPDDNEGNLTEHKQIKHNVSESSYEKKVSNNDLVGHFQSEKVVSVNDMSEVHDKIAQLIQKRDGMLNCLACEYISTHTGHMKEHVERHIEGLSFSCQFCEKSFRLSSTLRKHIRKDHNTKYII